MNIITGVDLELRGYTQCANCEDLVHQDLAVVKTYYEDGELKQEVFCCPACKAMWCEFSLRKAGM